MRSSPGSLPESLQIEGANVLQAVDGEDGIERFNEHRHEINAVVLDLTMPKLNGEEVFRQIKAARPDVPVVLCSGYSVLTYHPLPLTLPEPPHPDPLAFISSARLVLGRSLLLDEVLGSSTSSI